MRAGTEWRRPLADPMRPRPRPHTSPSQIQTKSSLGRGECPAPSRPGHAPCQLVPTSLLPCPPPRIPGQAPSLTPQSSRRPGGALPGLTGHRVHERRGQARGEEQGHPGQGRAAGSRQEQVECGGRQGTQGERGPRPALVRKPGGTAPVTLTDVGQGPVPWDSGEPRPTGLITDTRCWEAGETAWSGALLRPGTPHPSSGAAFSDLGCHSL